MKCLYLTADRIGQGSGGGSVTFHERRALERFCGPTNVVTLSAEELGQSDDPFSLDARALVRIRDVGPAFDLAHLYAGCFSKTVKALKSLGTTVTYTAAAHDREKSIAEFKALGIEFPFRHLLEPEVWLEYLRGYTLADRVICPSAMSADLMRSYGCPQIEVIPHGIDRVKRPIPFPARFNVGYMGQAGPDKGLVYLLRAWKQLRYQDSTLILAGHGILTAVETVHKEGGGNISIIGPVRKLKDFYQDISLYVQPSVTEGFGMEILEALAHGRPVVASRGAGASSHVGEDVGIVVPERDSDAIGRAIARFKSMDAGSLNTLADRAHAQGNMFRWKGVERAYVKFWTKLLGELASRDSVQGIS